ncbi:MAG: hypothetical protein F4Z58_00845 [Acidimicrobiaceae bacterium]|nr:hypothetical protein [Acidimicrobiaceae bacterium]MYD05413.1 hypothetical protein [Acidimicrobiaceae bacterium]MYI59872.1 hypothetical protein [Acidimicrobiaceae bacterium]
MSSETVVDVLNSAETQEAIQFNLDLAECTWEELQQQAKAGQFTSETARRAWFMVSSLVEAG